MKKYSKVIVFFISGFITVFVLILMLILFTLNQFNALQNQVDQFETEFHLKNEALSSFAENAHKRTVVLLKMYKTNDAFERDELFKRFHTLAYRVASANKTYLSLNLSDNEKIAHQKIYQHIKKSSALRSHIADLLIQREDEKAIELIVNESVPAQESVLTIIEELQDILEHNHRQYMDDTKEKQKKNMLGIVVMGVLLFSIFSIQVFFIIRYILKKENIQLKRADVLLDVIGHGVLTTDTTGKVDYINPFASIILEAIGCQALGESFDDLRLIHKKGETQPLLHIVSKMIQNPKVNQHYNQCYIQYKNKEAVFWVSLTVSSIMSEQDKFLGVVIIMTDISEVHALNEKLKYEANHDKLTSLYNRKSIEEKLSAAVHRSSSEKSTSAVLYLDMDNFKYVNDNAGHPAGDQLLIDFSVLLKTHVREYDVVGRIGGDEFIILLYRCDLNKARDVAEKIIQAVNDYKLQWDNKIYSISTSIGITSINENSKNFEEVIQNADNALYEAKNSGKNCYKLDSYVGT